MYLIAILYLTIPVFIILFSFFSLPVVTIGAAALFILVFRLHKQLADLYTSPPIPLIKYWPLLLASIIATYFHLERTFNTPDWVNFFATANLIVDSPWPPTLEMSGQTQLLRYYVAWFIVPALLAKILDAHFLFPSMFIWSTVGLFIALLLIFHNLRKNSHFFVAVLVFFFFSGLDIVGAYITGRIEQAIHPYWLQWWAGEKLFVILSNFTNSFQCSPHHALAAYLPTFLFMSNRRLAVQYGALIAVVTAMWSPFNSIGILPIAAWALFKEGWKLALTPQNLIVAPLLSIPIALYLTQGTSEGGIIFMFTWEVANFSSLNFALFCMLEFLLILGVFYLILKKDRHLIATIAVFLTLLCTYRIGLYNDLLARGSMPAICAMSVLMLRSLLISKGWQRELLIAYVLVGAIPVVMAFSKAISMPMPKSYRNANFEQYLDMRPAEDREIYSSQYLVNVNSAWHVGSASLMRNLPSRGGD